MGNAMEEYKWLVVVGALGAFGFGWGTGANDVANAFGTSVGSKALTLAQAVVIAAIFEFTGALVLGRVSTNTIAGGIADVSSFTREPEVYAFGMVCALWVGFIWQGIASYLEMNVSATHSIIGGIVGFSLIYDGSSGVNWATKDPKAFPPYKGVLPIIMSWFISPILAAASSAFFFFILRTVVLRRANAYKLSFWVLPPIVFAVTWVNMYFVFTKGAKKYIEKEGDSWSDAKAVWVSVAIAAGCAFLAAIIGIPLMVRSSRKKIARLNAAGLPTAVGAGAKIDGNGTLEETENKGCWSCGCGGNRYLQWIAKAATHGMTVDVHKAVEEDEFIAKLHERAEKFDPNVEHVFGYLQVFSAICVVFAHGAGEVGYMAGPLATIWEVYTKGTISRSVTPQIWIILIGALGLVVGLATYGYNVTRAMGVKLAKLSPTRGMCAELATAFIIMIASQFMLPTSSSQVITGAIVGIGLLEGVRGGVNWWMFLRQFCSWISTLFVIGLLTAGLFSFGVYTPSLIQGSDVMVFEDRITALSSNIYSQFNTSLLELQEASEQNLLTNLPYTQWQELNATMADVVSTVDPTVIPENILAQLNSALALVQQYSVNSLGQNTVFPGAELCNAYTVPSLTANEVVACPAPQLIPES